MKNLTAAIVLFIGQLYAGYGFAQEIKSSAEDQSELAVTIYNNDLAMVRDQRLITLPVATSNLAFEGISGQIRPETAQLSSPDHGDQIELIEQNFEFDSLSPQALLKAYLGKQIGVISVHPTTGARTEEMATVVSLENGTVLQFADRIETLAPGQGTFSFAAVPSNVRARPTLLVTLNNAVQGPQQLELNYLTKGLSWEANYVAQLNAEETALNLNAWVSLTNQSGSDYNNAQLQLVAGDVNTVQPNRARRPGVFESDMVMASAQMGFSQESAADYHLYRLNRPTNLKDKQTKQVALFAASSIPFQKNYVLQIQPQIYMSRFSQPQDDFKVSTELKFVNDSKSALGDPLPKGVIRIYQNGNDGHALFIGESRISHTPTGKTVTLNPGNAFDITASREQLEFEQLPVNKPYRLHTKSTVATTLYNAKKTPVRVRVEETIPGQWEVTSGQDVDKKQGNLAIWFVDIDPQSKTTLQYTLSLKL